MSSESTSETGESGTDRLDNISYDTDLFDINNLPSRGNPLQLIRIVHFLMEGGGKSVDEIVSSLDGIGQTYVSQNLKNGENFGFIDRSQEGVVLTDRGYELGFDTEVSSVKSDGADDNGNGDESNGEEELDYEIADASAIQPYYRSGLREFDDYLELLKALYMETDDNFDKLIENSDILEILRTKFGVREAKEAKLKRQASQLFYNLQAAGFGEFMTAGGGYPARLSLSSEHTLETILLELMPQEVSEAEDEPSVSEEQDSTDRPAEQSDRVNLQRQSDSDFEESEKDAEKLENASERAGVSAQATSPESKPGVSTHKEVNIDVNVDLDLDQVDTAELEAKLDLLRDLMN